MVGLNASDIMSAIPLLGIALSEIIAVFTCYYFAFKIGETLIRITRGNIFGAVN